MTKSTDISLGPADAFPLDTFRIVTVGRREIGVLRQTDGRVHAVRNLCPHKGAPMCKAPPTGTTLPGPPGSLTWGLDGKILRCPWHGYEFHIETGARPFTDSRMRLRIYPARIENGEIRVDLGPQVSPQASKEANA